MVMDNLFSEKRRKEAERKRRQREKEKSTYTGDFKKVFWNEGKINPPEVYHPDNPEHALRVKNGERIYVYKYYKMKRNRIMKKNHEI